MKCNTLLPEGTDIHEWGYYIATLGVVDQYFPLIARVLAPQNAVCPGKGQHFRQRGELPVAQPTSHRAYTELITISKKKTEAREPEMKSGCFY